MDANECNIFADIINENHTLWGLHMTGNDCVLNSMGFVKAGQKKLVQE